MRLIGYGPGEICDRLSILVLKIQHGIEASKSVDHFRTELDQLMTQSIRPDTINVLHLTELALVNAGIWEGEDELRVYRNGFDESQRGPSGVAARVIEVAFRLQRLNDRRHELISLINVNAGHAVQGEEKVR